MTQRMTFEIENEEKLKEIKDLIKKIESDVDIIEESYE